MATKESPCKDCERRFVGCHSKCADYAESRKQYEAAKAAARENHRGDHEFFGFAARSRDRNYKEKWRKQK